MKKSLFLLALLFVFLSISASYALTAGDLAIIAVNTDAVKNFAFVALADIPANTTITFTDNAWTAVNGPFATTEGNIQWLNTSTTTAGTVVVLTLATVYSASVGSVNTSTNFNLSATGDQIYAFEGDWSARPTTGSATNFLFAISIENFIVTGATSSNTSYLASALAGASAAMTTSATEYDNAYFANGSTSQTSVSVSGSKIELLALFTDTTKYYKNDTGPLTLPTYTITVNTGGNVPPSIANIVQTPATGIISTTTVSISADVTDTAKSVASVKLQWGTSTGEYPSEINMALGSAPTYTTVSNIPAQTNGTTVYYRVQATDDENATANSSEYSYTVQDPIPDPPVVEPASGITENSFTANWQAVSGATGYYLDVYTLEGDFASDLIISEYIEGSSNNKAIEIYNGTGATVDLSNYTINLYSAPSTTPGNILEMTGTLAHGDVYVIANSGAIAEILALADVTSTVTFFNGDDTIELINELTKGRIDLFGCIGEDPGTAWGTAPLSTAENTLVRKNSVSSGNTTSTTGFPTLATEWDGFAQNTTTYLGSHTMSGFTQTYVLQNYNVGNVTSYPVTGLAPNTVYYYVVRAYNEYGVSSANSGVMALPGDGTTPVELSSFSAVITAQNYVMINWTTQTETNVAGYYIYRNTLNDLEHAFQIPALIAATNTSQETSYSFVDQEVEPGNTYYYWLQNMDMGGSSDFHGPISVILPQGEGPITPVIPTVTELLDAYPNPFGQSSGTRIHYTLKTAENVKLEVYNIRGQIVWTANYNHDKAGDYRIRWDGKDMSGKPVSTGVYNYRMTAGKYTSSKKVILMK